VTLVYDRPLPPCGQPESAPRGAAAGAPGTVTEWGVLSNELSPRYGTLAHSMAAPEVIPSGLVYLGIASTFLGLVAPAAWIVGIGVAMVFLGLAWPSATLDRSRGSMRLDAFLPASHFHEVHSIRIDAAPERIWRAIHEVTAREIRFFLLLTWIRSPRLRRLRKESILNPRPREPILDVALRSGFVLLAEDESREVVFGAVLEGGRFRPAVPADQFRGLSEEGLAKTAMNFHLVEEPPGRLILTTETRVFATGPRSRRLFAMYWRLILPGSALIRRTWLAAIRRRAEGAAA
jgi:hypothetical protein